MRRRHECSIVCRNTLHVGHRVDGAFRTSGVFRRGPLACGIVGPAALRPSSPPDPSRTCRRARHSSRLLPAGLRCRGVTTPQDDSDDFVSLGALQTEERDVAAGVKRAPYVSLCGHHVRVVGPPIVAAHNDESLATGESGRPFQRSLNEAWAPGAAKAGPARPTLRARAIAENVMAQAPARQIARWRRRDRSGAIPKSWASGIYFSRAAEVSLNFVARSLYDPRVMICWNWAP